MSDQADEIPRRILRAEQVLLNRSRRVSLVLEGSQDPHNVHAVLRTAEALGVQDVHLVAPRGNAAAISPGVTQRAHDWLSLHRHEDIDAAVELLRGEGRSIWATANEDTATSLTGFSPEGRIAVLFGNETLGLSERARELADGLLRIDLVGFSGSLNLSVSAAIVLWEMRRRELVATPGDLSEAESSELRKDWFHRRLRRRGPEDGAESWLARSKELRAAAEQADRLMPGQREGSE